MKHQQIEVEIKTLLGSVEAAQSLVSRMRENDPDTKIIGSSSQLNHYFTSGNVESLKEELGPKLPKTSRLQFDQIIAKASSLSVRTRKADDKVLFIMKATLDETSSSNGTARAEFEVAMSGLTIDQLDEILLKAGYMYQAKWSRERQEYQYKKYTVAIDKNAGYGYLAEFERLITDPSQLDALKTEIRGEMAKLGVLELPQDRLERMFQFYNAHWQEYYGTDKTFVIQ